MSLRVGVIGLGIGKAHVAGYSKLEGVDLVAVCDLERSRVDRFANSSTNGYTSAVDMLGREDLDAVSICTPPKAHAGLTVEALDQGVSVLCEKPMAPSIADCDRMVESAKRAGLTLMIGFKKRFDPAYLRLKKIFSDDFGLPYMLCYNYVCTGGVRKEWFWDEANGGGPIVENTVHAVDILRFLLGDVSRVYAEGDATIAGERGISQIDASVFTLRFKKGTMATLCAGSWAKGPLKEERMVAYSERGIAQLSGEFDRPRSVKISIYGEGSVESYEIFRSDPILDEISHFVGCVEKGVEPVASGLDGRSALEICLSVKESARTGKVISLPI